MSRTPRGEWWQSYFDARYLLEYEPLFDLERDRREVARLIEILELPDGARILDPNSRKNVEMQHSISGRSLETCCNSTARRFTSPTLTA